MQLSIRFLKNDRVGAASAETDAKFLREAFVDTGDVTVLQDTTDPRCIVVGRTGAGKTALLLRLASQSPHAHRIDPVNVALGFMEAQTLLPALADAQVNLDGFFRFLWRQTLTVELLRGWKALESANQWADVKAALIRALPIRSRSKQRNHVLDEIERWAGEAWEDAASHTKSVISKFDREVRLTLGNKHLVHLEAAYKGGHEVAPPQTTSVSESATAAQTAVTRVINLQRSRDCYEFLSSDVLTDSQRPHFILIDHLDNAWVESTFAYDLIDALIEVAGEFAELGNVKVVVALREDIIEHLHSQTKRRNRQWEKHKTLFLRLSWSPRDITEIVDRRLKTLLKGRYGGKVSLHTLLPPPRPGMRGSTLDYVIRRTLLRPRDLIAFTNAMLEAMVSADTERLSWEVLTHAEAAYSRGRLEALENEWRPNYLGLEEVFDLFRGQEQPFKWTELDVNRLGSVLASGELAAKDATLSGRHLPAECFNFVQRTQEYESGWHLLLSVLYTIGFVGAKWGPEAPLTYSYENPLIPPQPIPGTVAFQVHPAFWRVLDISGSPWAD